MESLRLFVAVELPEAWKQALEGLPQQMQAALAADATTRDARVRWVRPEAVHLTLKFLGEVPPERLQPIETALASAVPQPPRLELRLAHVGSFSDRRAPRVILATLEVVPQRGLLDLVERLETWLAAAGFPRERRPFAPHLTLARLPDDLSQPTRERIAALTSALPLPNLPPLTVERVSLIRSYLGPGGARYERLATYPA